MDEELGLGVKVLGAVNTASLSLGEEKYLILRWIIFPEWF